MEDKGFQLRKLKKRHTVIYLDQQCCVKIQTAPKTVL